MRLQQYLKELIKSDSIIPEQCAHEQMDPVNLKEWGDDFVLLKGTKFKVR